MKRLVLSSEASLQAQCENVFRSTLLFEQESQKALFPWRALRGNNPQVDYFEVLRTIGSHKGGYFFRVELLKEVG